MERTLPVDVEYPFAEFPWDSRAPDPRAERLCTDPYAGGDLDCALEGANFAPPGLPSADELVVMAYNIQRGFKVSEQLTLLKGDPGMPRPDIILVSEADRGCSRTGFRNVLRDMAQDLEMCYVFGVEFQELPRRWGAGGRLTAPCEHGNGILSRYPLGNVRLIRHASRRSWENRRVPIIGFGEPRRGGRVALAADVKAGDRFAHVYSVHLESGKDNDIYRSSQAVELAEDGLRKPFATVIGGDMNTRLFLSDLVSQARMEPVTQGLFHRGYTDAHAFLPSHQRITTRSGIITDLIFGKGDIFTAAGIGPGDLWQPLSDHLPVWATVRLAQ